MGKPKSIIDEIKSEVKQNKKENTMKNSTRKETVKTILITILITGIIAFIGGMVYQSSNQAQVHAEAKALTVESLKAEASLKQ